MKVNKRMHMVALLSLVVSLLSSLLPTVALAAVANPDLVQACGIDVILVLDESGSIVGAGSADDISQQVRDGANALIGALADTGSHVAVVEFNSNARTPIGWTEVTSGGGGTIATTFQPYLAVDGNTTPESSQYDPEDYGSSQYWTNWEAAFIAVAALQGTAPTGNPPLVVFFTDGNPTAYYSPTGTVGTVGNLVNNAATATALSEGALAADVVKGNGSHIFVVGLPNPSVTTSNVVAISGPDAYDGTNFSTADYTTSSVDDLVDDLRDVAFQLCAPSLTLTKWVDGVKAADWEFSGTVTITESGQDADGYDWVSPVTGAASSEGTTQSATTGTDGTVLFQWNPGSTASPMSWTSQIEFNETPQTGYQFVEALCTRKTLDAGGVTETPFTISSWPATVAFGTDDIVTCDVYNQFIANPALTIEKTGDAGPVSIGGTVNYTIKVTNSGNVTLNNVTVVDAKLGINQNVGDLAPGAYVDVSGSYGPVTESDLPGPIVNTASATSDETPDPVDDDHSVDIETNPALSIEKTGDAGPVSIGGTVNYNIRVTNSGDVTLHNVIVVDAKLDINQNVGTLAPGAFVDVSGSYGPVTESDLLGPIYNTASATSDETPTPVQDEWTVEIVINPQITIDKQISDSADGPWADSLEVVVGTGIYYRFVVENTGDVPLDVTVTDPTLAVLLGLSADHNFCDGVSLDPGSSYTCGPFGPVLAEYTGQDGTFPNTAVAEGCYDGFCDDDEDTAEYSGQYWGFTPGFWKNHAKGKHYAWGYTTYDPGDGLCDAFEAAGSYFNCEKTTMLKALSLKGGRGERGAAEILLRAGTAALLNASFHETLDNADHPAATIVIGDACELQGPDGICYYPYASATLMDLVDGALASGDRETMLELAAELDGYNNGIHDIDWSWPRP
jgi:hypothetical protein